MKIRTTKKEITSNYDKIINIPYCHAQFILRGIDPIAYTAGAYGWNADIYEITPEIAIVTRYRPFGNYRSDAATVASFEKRARETSDPEEIAAIRAEFINQIINK